MANCSALPDLENISCKSRSVLEILYIALAPVTLIVNCLLMTAMIGTKQALSNTSNILIMFMSVFNTISATVSMPLLALVFSSYRVTTTLVIASQFIGSFLFFLSSLVMILMAVDRYLHMDASLTTRRSMLRKLFTRKWIAVPLAMCIASSLLISVASIKLFTFGNISIIIILVLLAVLNLILMPGIAALYIRGYIRVKKFAQQNPVYCNARQPCIENSQTVHVSSTDFKPAYVRNLQKTVLSLIIALMITHTPFAIAAIMLPIFHLIGKQPTALLIIYDIITLIYYHHFLVNGLIVFKMNKKARSWLLRPVYRVIFWSHLQRSGF